MTFFVTVCNIRVMIIDNYGIVTLNIDDIVNGLYSGKIINLDSVICDHITANQFNLALNINKDRFNKLTEYSKPNISVEEFDKNNQQNWFMPKDYCPNLIQSLYDSCSTKEEIDRVNLELELFIQHDMLDLLHYLKYLVDVMRKNKIVWGVGRGSSVSSYVLFLIGIHKINSIKYGLDIHEFLK